MSEVLSGCVCLIRYVTRVCVCVCVCQSVDSVCVSSMTRESSCMSAMFITCVRKKM